MTYSIKETDIAWAAGFIDGEGCIFAGIRRSYGSLHLRLSATNLDPRPINRLKKVLGGKIRLDNPTVGSYRWYISGDEMTKVLKLLIPHLSVKKEQAKLALQLRALVQSRKGKCGWRDMKLSEEEWSKREKLCSKIKALKIRGKNIILREAAKEKCLT